MPHYKVTQLVYADDEEQAKAVAGANPWLGDVDRFYTFAEIEAYRTECYENGDVPCDDPAGHVWAVSDENENYCYCEKCGCCEY